MSGKRRRELPSVDSGKEKSPGSRASHSIPSPSTLGAAFDHDDRMALFVQQLHFLMERGGERWQGKHWVYKTYDDFLEYFSWASKDAVRKVVDRLRARGVIATVNRLHGGIRYRIDYRQLQGLCVVKGVVSPAWVDDAVRALPDHDDFQPNLEVSEEVVSAASGSDVPYEGDTDPTAILETRLRDLEAEVADLTAAADADVVAYLGMDILTKYRLRNEDRERYDDLMHRAGPIMAVRGKLGDAKTAAMNAALAARHTVEEAPAPMVVETPDLVRAIHRVVRLR